MSRPGRILIMDDLRRWRNEISEALADTDYQVKTAATRSEAVELFNSEFFHILILDIRMNDEDVLNEEGLDLLKQMEKAGRENAIRVIMCSGYGKENDRTRTAFLYGAEDFLDKGKFSDAELLKVVKQIFDEKLRINLELDIHWQQGLTNQIAVQNLLLGNQRVKKNTPLCDLISVELEDLLCRLFHDAKGLLAAPLIPGRSGAGVLRAQPFYKVGGGRSMVVKYGDFDKIDLEYKNFRTYIQPFVGGGRSTTVLGLRRSPRLGGIAYSFLGTASGDLRDFGAFYQETQDLPPITALMDELFNETCGHWYANIGQLCLIDLYQDYSKLLNLQRERLYEARNRLKSVKGKDKLQFGALSANREFTNPIPVLSGKSWPLSTYKCVTHGDLNPHNILVDQEAHAWLIDFQQTGEGHFLRDFIQLDCAIRFELLTPGHATLDQRLALEETLLAAGSSAPEKAALPEGLGTPELRKAFRACMHLRALAGSQLAKNPGSTLKELHIGSAYFALNYLRFYRAPAQCREHALLSASLLSDLIQA